MHRLTDNVYAEDAYLVATVDIQHIVPGHGAPCGHEAVGRVKAAVTSVIDEVRQGWETGWSREEAQDRIRYIDRYTYPAPMRERYYHLERLGVGRIYDWLNGHI